MTKEKLEELLSNHEKITVEYKESKSAIPANAYEKISDTDSFFITEETAKKLKNLYMVKVWEDLVESQDHLTKIINIWILIKIVSVSFITKVLI